MLLFLLCLLFVFLSAIINVAANRVDIDNVIIVNLSISDSHYDMGVEYGKLLEMELNDTLTILFDYFLDEHHMSYQQLLQESQLFDDRYSYSWDFFLKGIATGSGLTFNDCKIINSMETIRVPSQSYASYNGLAQCAFLSLPPSICGNNTTLIGRNYDYGHPFNEIAKNIIVAVLHETEKISTAIVGLPGQIYCPSCLNEYGIFMELNNGGPSGGFAVVQRQTLLIKLLQTLQNSRNMNDVLMQMDSFQSDYSLIINVNDAQSAGQSYEYSSTLGMKPFHFLNNESFVSTNFYLNDTWNDIPPPNDITSWLGVTRRKNLLNLTATSREYNIADLLDIMDVKMEDGGALSPSTIYQIVFEPKTSSLFITNRYQENWTNIQLQDFW